jgi:peptide/nickel transport system substrate-binding protein
MTDDSTDVSETCERNFSRRRALQLAAGGSTALLAGCSGSTPRDGSGSTSQDVEVLDKTYITYLPDSPTSVQFNPLSTAPTDFYTKSAVHAWTAQVSSGVSGESKPTWMPMVAKNWEFDGTTFRVELNDSFSWHDGKPLTAADLALQYNIDRHMSAGKYYDVWDFVKSVEATGKHTLEMKVAEQTNEVQLVNAAFGEPIAYPPQTFGKYLERFRNASSESEKRRSERRSRNSKSKNRWEPDR